MILEPLQQLSDLERVSAIVSLAGEDGHPGLFGIPPSSPGFPVFIFDLSGWTTSLRTLFFGLPVFHFCLPPYC